VIPALDHLKAQRCNFSWELVAVNNNSTDDSAAIVANAWHEMKNDVPLQAVNVVTPGLKFARESGIEASTYGYIVFCDDDNLLSPDYLQTVYDQFEGDPDIGLIGGLGVASSDIPLPDWFSAFHNLYAVGKPVEYAGVLKNGVGYVYGAGMALRKAAWKKLLNFGFRSVAVDRRGNQLTSGHDVEMSHALRLIGYKVVFSDVMIFSHVIAKRRLEEEYLVSLMRGSSASFVSFVYFIMFERRISGFVDFAFIYCKRMVAEASRALRIIFRSRSLENKVILAMSVSSFWFLVGNFRNAWSYFRHVTDIRNEVTRQQ
jgi:glycosyltransferase involved in cell wall biosynthesis